MKDLNLLNASQVEEIVSLRVKLSTAESKLLVLRDELNRAQSESMDQSEESATIAHIRGNLSQFLRNTPFTDPKNEEMLRIVYSMMDFTK